MFFLAFANANNGILFSYHEVKMTIILNIKTEDGQVAELPVLDKIKLGRSSSSDYKIVDTKMSGIHCSFEINNQGELLFKDLESTNGSFLNNSKITQTLMRIGDIIRIGNTLIRIDESKLNAREKASLGESTANSKNDKTLPGKSDDATKVLPRIAPKKKTISLNKEIKERKPLRSDWAAGSDNIIEQEESSGMTKMLKLNTKKKK
jgi:pSer/pThr/pTyr-binding forkhead associated (FHA) protein